MILQREGSKEDLYDCQEVCSTVGLQGLGGREEKEGTSLWAAVGSLVDVTWVPFSVFLISLTISIIIVHVWGEAGVQAHVTVVWMSEENFQEWVLLPSGSGSQTRGLRLAASPSTH